MAIPFFTPTQNIFSVPGRMHLFATMNQAVHTTWKTSTDPDSPWSGWVEMGGTVKGFTPTGSPLVGYLPDGRMQLFVGAQGGDHFGVLTTSKASADPNAPWNDWVVLFEQDHSSDIMCLGYLPDGRMQLFIYVSNLGLRTCWKTNTDSNSTPNSNWSEVSLWDGASADGLPPLIGYLLPDRRMQIFCLPRTRWKLTTDPDAAWSEWQSLDVIPSSSDFLDNVYVAPPTEVGYLPDGRMQLVFLGAESLQVQPTNSQANVYSVWKRSHDPNSVWSPAVSLGFQARSSPVVGYWPDHRMQIFVIGMDFSLATSWKSSDHPNALWSDWLIMEGPPYVPNLPNYQPGDNEFLPSSLAVGFLPDGRMQIFTKVINGALQKRLVVYSEWQLRLETGSHWSKWVEMGTFPVQSYALTAAIATPSIGYLPPEPGTIGDSVGSLMGGSG